MAFLLGILLCDASGSCCKEKNTNMIKKCTFENHICGASGCNFSRENKHNLKIVGSNLILSSCDLCDRDFMCLNIYIPLYWCSLIRITMRAVFTVLRKCVTTVVDILKEN